MTPEQQAAIEPANARKAYRVFCIWHKTEAIVFDHSVPDALRQSVGKLSCGCRRNGFVQIRRAPEQDRPLAVRETR
jgi:hypothetical protein